MKKILLLIVDWVWGFPQTLLGLILSKTFWIGCKEENKLAKEFGIELYVTPVRCYNGHPIFGWFYRTVSGVSLGHYVFLHYYDNNETTLRHEYGHVVQSRMLGWLYLLVIGIPSVYGNLLARVNEHRAKTYYQHYPEHWADKLGGVKR